MRQSSDSPSASPVNRIDDIATFNWIDENMLQEIISLGIGQLNTRLQRHKCEIRLDPSMAAHLAQVGFDKQYGVRSMKRAIRR